MDGVLTCGTTGEGVLLSVLERRRMTELCLEARPEGFAVAVHAGAQTTEHTVELSFSREGGRGGRRRGDRSSLLPTR
jgi:dihydrodipicolinate synthase/N-acetylneuraminate lyase